MDESRRGRVAAMRAGLARTACGVIAGVLLASARLPLGTTLFEVPLASPEKRHAIRALAFAVCAIAGASVLPSLGTRGAMLELLCGTLAGWLLTCFLIHPWIGPGIVSACAAAILVAAVSLVARWLARGESDGSAEDRVGAPLAALSVLSAAAALALERLSQYLGQLGGGLELDAAVLGAVFLALAAIGALCFGHLPRALFGASGERRALPITLCLVPLLSVVGFAVVRGLASARGLERFLGNLGLDGSLWGTLRYDVAVAVPVLVAPAFALGAALGQARARGELAAILAGAAVALAAYPWVLELALGTAGGVARPKEGVLAASVVLGSIGLLVAAAVSELLSRGSGRRSRWFLATLLSCSALAILAMRGAPRRVAIVTPWEQRAILPERVIETLGGVFVVERVADSMRVVRCDGRALTPEPRLLGAEAQRIEWSLDLLPAERRSAARVLLVGQLSPERADMLVSRGAARVDRTGVWHESMDEIEETLFASANVSHPAGEIVAPARARERLASGAYDLVLVPPVEGEVPLTSALDSTDDAVVVIWLDGESALFSRDLPREGLLSTDAFEGLAIGLVHGGARGEPGGPVFLALGEPRGRWESWRRLGMRAGERVRSARASLAARIADASRDSDHEAVTRGLAMHWAAQEASSPFDASERRVELDEAALQELSRAALAGVPDRLTRALWDGLAHLLAAKRDVEQVYRWLAPLATAHAPWPELELALAEADIESLEPTRAVERLLPLVPETGADPRFVWMLARAHSAAGEHARAGALLERIVAAGIRWRELPRAQAIELFLAGDARGRPLLEALDPSHDALVRRLLERGAESDDGGFDAVDPWEGARGG